MPKKQTQKKRPYSKNDAPMKIQYEIGYKAFRKGKLDCPYYENSMAAREWQRGFNAAYFANLK